MTIEYEEKLIMKAVIVVCSILLLMVSCTGINRYFGFDDDHVVEEGCEAIIRQKFGLDVDLSIESKER